jgi:hypothetical protein
MTTGDISILIAGVVVQVITTLRKGKGVETRVKAKVEGAETSIVDRVNEGEVKINGLIATAATKRELKEYGDRLILVRAAITEMNESFNKRLDRITNMIEDSRYSGPRVEIEEPTGKVEVKEVPTPKIGKVKWEK